jgi:hypothetical protein
LIETESRKSNVVNEPIKQILKRFGVWLVLKLLDFRFLDIRFSRLAAR